MENNNNNNATIKITRLPSSMYILFENIEKWFYMQTILMPIKEMTLRYPIY